MWFCVFCVCMIFLYVCLIQPFQAAKIQQTVCGLWHSPWAHKTLFAPPPACCTLNITVPFASEWVSGWIYTAHYRLSACKKAEWWGAGVVICLERRADLHMAQLMPLPLTVSCFSKIQNGFTFLVPAHLGSPGKRAVKRVCVLSVKTANALVSKVRC